MSKKLFVGNLSWDTTDDKLKEIFSKFGEVEEAIIIKEHDTDRSRGFGFVKFKKDEAADKAIEEMDGKDLDGRNINVNEAKPVNRN